MLFLILFPILKTDFKKENKNLQISFLCVCKKCEQK